MTGVWRGVADGLLPSRRLAGVEGHWPSALRGTLFRNGPGLFQRGGALKPHLLDGDGLAQAWRFEDGCIRYQAAFVPTAKFVEEQKQGCFLYPGLASVPPDSRPVFRPDDMNTANTNLVLHGGSLYALWEAGSAHELCPETLQSRGLKIWAPEVEGAPFGAHPKRDRSGYLWAVGVAPGCLLIYKIGPDGVLLQAKCHALQASAMVHDFALTERFLLIWMAPLEVMQSRLQDGSPLLEALHWNSSGCSRLLVVDRERLEIVHVLESGPELQTHVANAWDDGDWIHLQHVITSFDSLVHGLRADRDAAGSGSSLWSQAAWCHLQLSSGEVTCEPLVDLVEFPQVDQRYSGRRHHVAFHLAMRTPSAAGPAVFGGLRRLDLSSGRQSGWQAPHEILMEEHVFVPRSGGSAEGDGWLIGTGFDGARGATFCSVFDAEHLADGPVAMAYLDGPMPACLHGEFVAA